MTRTLTWSFVLLTFMTATGISHAENSYIDTIKSRMVHEVVIERSMEDVFDYATTASNWKDWHPNTRRTAGANDHSATEGEHIVEFLKIGHAPAGRLYWTVTRHIPPSEWQIKGRDQIGYLRYLITYTLTYDESGATVFRRELEYELDKTPLNVLMNQVSFKPFLEVMSRRAIHNFKKELTPLRPTESGY